MIDQELLSPMNFEDLAPIEVPVTIAGEEYVLREISEGGAVMWRNAQLRYTRIADGKLTSLEGMAETEPLLVSLCLFKKMKSGNGYIWQNVPIDQVKKMPPRVVKSLHERAKGISRLEEDNESPEALEKKMTELASKIAKAPNAKEIFARLTTTFSQETPSSDSSGEGDLGNLLTGTTATSS